jgi:hypothetical protein
MKRGLRRDSDTTPALVIMSGADVELSGSPGSPGKSLAIEDLELNLPAGASAVFAQITPEPSKDLRDASRRLRGVSEISYLDYSETLADELSTNLLRTAESRNTGSAKALARIVGASHGKQMMVFLPRVLTSTSQLPAPVAAPPSDWYAVHLWLAVDELIWTVSMR